MVTVMLSCCLMSQMPQSLTWHGAEDCSRKCSLYSHACRDTEPPCFKSCNRSCITSGFHPYPLMIQI